LRQAQCLDGKKYKIKNKNRRIRERKSGKRKGKEIRRRKTGG
jgi:hypothetical protein